jgi:predicted permease
VSALISILAIYFFILLGYYFKRTFKDEINEKTLILLSMYILQPILTFWGLTRVEINYNLIITPFIYFLVVTSTLILLIVVARFMFKNEDDKSIFITTSLIGNTGNLGIPLGIALFGEQSIAYTSIINIANVFFIYTVGVFYFAKSSYTFKQSIFKMVKIPILWFAIFALLYNYFEFTINTQINQALEMGAYATIVLQLIIFGIYLSGIKLQAQNKLLVYSTTFVKLILLPIIGIIFVKIFNLPSQIASILIVSLSVPLAVNTVNIAALYNCKPYEVTYIVFLSTLVFLMLFYFDLELIKIMFEVQ